MTEFSAKNWFEHYMGFEESYESVMNNLYIEDFDNHSELISKANNKRYNCGKFLLRDVSSFSHLFANNTSNNSNGHLHIIRGNGRKSSRYDLVDVLQHQNNDEFEGATFLSCSNFNCLEFPHANCSARFGIFKYATDMTQGPILQSASIASTIYRNYFVKHKKIPSITDEIKNIDDLCNYFVDINSDSNVYYNANDQNEGDKSNIYQGQVDYELNLLERTPIPVRHGKAVLDREQLNLINSKLFQDFDFSNENAYLIGVHQNCTVSTSRKQDFTLLDTLSQNKIVHQVFASTLSMGGYASKTPKNYEIMRNILFNMYKLTILAAWENSIMYPDHPGSKKCVLSLLGCGSFSNPVNDVAEAIKSNKELIQQSGLDVYIVCFDEGFFVKAENILRDVVSETEGTIIDAR